MAARVKKALLAVILGGILTVLTGITALSMPTPASIQGMAGSRSVEECGDPYRFGFPISGGADYTGPCAPYEGMSVTFAAILDLLIWIALIYLLIMFIEKVITPKSILNTPHA